MPAESIEREILGLVWSLVVKMAQIKREMMFLKGLEDLTHISLEIDCSRNTNGMDIGLLTFSIFESNQYSRHTGYICHNEDTALLPTHNVD